MLIASSFIRAIGLPSEHAIICEVVPPQFRSTAICIFNTCGSGAGGVDVLLAGLFKKEYGLTMIFGSCSLLSAAAGLMLRVVYYFFTAKDMARVELHALQAARQ